MKGRRANVFVSYAKGAGSVLDIASTSACRRLVPRESFSERLEADFRRVGDSLRHGLDSVSNEGRRSDAA